MRRKQQDERPDDLPEVTRRTIKRDPHTSQLIERGEGPTAEEVLDPEVGSPSEITEVGGPGTDAAYREGGPMSSARPPVNPRAGGTGGDGGYSTLGGGVYPDEGEPEDASHTGE
jgi:hypothetical protein